MSKSPSTPPYTSSFSHYSPRSDANKSQTVAALQPQRSFHFRRPTNSSKRKNTKSCHPFPVSYRFSSGEQASHSRANYPQISQTHSAPVLTPTHTPKLYFQDCVSAYYGISEDPYCKPLYSYTLFVIQLLAEYITLENQFNISNLKF